MKTILSLILFASFNVTAGIIINEFQPNQPGTDKPLQSIELFSDHLAEYNNLTLLAIEADANSNLGSINSQNSNIFGTFDEFGLSSFTIDDLENPSFILLLLQDFIFETNTDLDQDNDGFFDSTIWFEHVLDAIGIYDSQADFEANSDYLNQINGTHFKYTGAEPQLIFRDGQSQHFYASNNINSTTIYNQFGETFALDQFSVNPNEDSFSSINPHLVIEVSEPQITWLWLFLFWAVIQFKIKQQSRINRLCLSNI